LRIGNELVKLGNAFDQLSISTLDFVMSVNRNVAMPKETIATYMIKVQFGVDHKQAILRAHTAGIPMDSLSRERIRASIDDQQ